MSYTCSNNGFALGLSATAAPSCGGDWMNLPQYTCCCGCCDMYFNPPLNRIPNPNLPVRDNSCSVAYGGLYNATAAALPALVAGVPAQVALPAPMVMPPAGMDYAPINSITIAQSGTYAISVSLNATTDMAATFTLSARAAGAALPQLSFTESITAAGEVVLGGTAIVTLTAGTVIDLAVTATAAATLTLHAGNGASLALHKVSAASCVPCAF